MPKRLLSFLLLLASTSAAWGQITDFEKYKLQREQEMKTFEEKVMHDMDSLRSAHDKAFAKMLEGNWTREELFPSKPVPEKPKPDTPPIFNPKDEKPEKDAPQIKIQEASIPDQPAPPKQEEEKPNSSLTDQSFGSVFQFQSSVYFGNEWNMVNLKATWPTMQGNPDPSKITAYWTACSNQPYDKLVAYFQAQRQLFTLSDWGMYQLIERTAKGNFKQQNDQNLFMWFNLVQLGYDVRIMYSDNQVVLTLPFDAMLYGKSYFAFGNKNYFVFDENHATSLYTYTSQHESAKKTFNLNNNTQAKYPSQWEQRTFKFNFNGKEQVVELPYIKHRIQFHASIPQTELDYYFGQPLATSFSQKLHEALDDRLSALSTEREKVRYLYALVCQSIPYKTDQDQFNHEKFCLPEEVLAYPFADCEDRTFLLNALLTELIGIETIGLNYPGHVAMAVKLKDIHNSDALIQYNGNSYVYCDPTYIGADVGMMPTCYNQQRPEVLR